MRLSYLRQIYFFSQGNLDDEHGLDRKGEGYIDVLLS